MGNRFLGGGEIGGHTTMGEPWETGFWGGGEIGGHTTMGNRGKPVFGVGEGLGGGAYDNGGTVGNRFLGWGRDWGHTTMGEPWETGFLGGGVIGIGSGFVKLGYVRFSFGYVSTPRSPPRR